MAKKPKRMTRKELREPDEVQVALKGLWDWLERHWRLLAGAGLAVLAVGAATTVMGSMAEDASFEQADALRDALAPLTAPVGDPPPGAAAQADGNVTRYPDRAAAVSTAIERLDGYVASQPDAPGVNVAKILPSTLRATGSDPAAAAQEIAAWLAANPGHLLEQSAMHALAEAHARAGSRSEALAAYQDLANRSSGLIRAIALMAVGDLQNPLAHPDGDHAKALTAYKEAQAALGPRPPRDAADIFAALSEPYIYAEMDSRLALLE